MEMEHDAVHFRLNTENLPTKLTAKVLAPCKVLYQVKNDVLCAHVVMGYSRNFHVSRLKIFHGAMEDAKRIAMYDDN